MLRIVVGSRALFVSLSILLCITAEAMPKHGRWAGAEQPNLLYDSGREAIWLTQRGLMKRVTYCVPPALPTGGTLRLRSTVTVEIKIDAEGKVEGARVIQGHPLLRQAVIEALREWMFEPMVVRDRVLRVVGRLKFVLSTLDTPTKKPGCLRGF